MGQVCELHYIDTIASRNTKALNNYLSIHKFKNDQIAKNYFPVILNLRGKKIKCLSENLFSSDEDFDQNNSLFIDCYHYENVKTKLLGGIGFVDCNGCSVIDISYNYVENIIFDKINSKHYHMIIHDTVHLNGFTYWYIHDCQIELS